VACFFGSIIGGYLAFFFQNYFGPGQLVVALGAVYAISAVGRAAGALWFMKLRDPVKYPQTLRGVIKGAFYRWRISRRPSQ
jgi:hypothetical protein